MSDQLPDDLSQWPDDDYTILGVTSNCSRVELKRAYNKLIKLYRPDKSPEKFSRVRQAYERVENHVKWAEKYRDDTSSSDKDNPAETNHQVISINNTYAEQDQEKINSPENQTDFNNQPDTIDVKVENPHLSSTSRTIIDAPCLSNNHEQDQTPVSSGEYSLESFNLLSTKAATAEDFQQLFWLNTIFPEYSPETEPCDWLVRGLLKQFDYNIFESLCSYIIQGKYIPLASDFDDVLEKIPASWKITLLQIRWKLMPAEKLIARITKDVKTIKSLCMIDHREDWLQFIVSTMLYLKIFSKTIPGNTEKDLSTLLAQLQEEFNATSDLHLKNSYMIDRIDMYDYLLKNVNWVNSVPSEFSSIIMKCIRDNFFFNGYINNVWDEFREYILDDLNYRYNEMRKLVRNHEVLTEFIFDNLTDVNECRYTSHDYNKNQFKKWILSIYYTARQSTSLDYDYLTFRKFIDTLMKENINPFHIITEYGVTESNPIQDAFAVIANHLRSRKHIVLIMCVAYIENKRNSNYDRSLLEILT